MHCDLHVQQAHEPRLLACISVTCHPSLGCLLYLASLQIHACTYAHAGHQTANSRISLDIFPLSYLKVPHNACTCKSCIPDELYELHDLQVEVAHQIQLVAVCSGQQMREVLVYERCCCCDAPCQYMLPHLMPYLQSRCVNIPAEHRTPVWQNTVPAHVQAGTTTRPGKHQLLLIGCSVTSLGKQHGSCGSASCSPVTSQSEDTHSELISSRSAACGCMVHRHRFGCLLGLTQGHEM